MKLLRYGPVGQEKPGMLDATANIRDLSRVVSDLDGTTISPGSLKKLAALDAQTLPLVTGNPRLGVPVTGVGKLVAIGLNFTDHAKEANMPIPSEPVVFMGERGASLKFPSCRSQTTTGLTRSRT